MRSLCLILFALIGLTVRAGTPSTQPAATSQPTGFEDMVSLPGGTFQMGTNDGYPYEAPAHDVTLKPFWIDKHELTVAQFAKFVKATGYKTEAEKWGWSGVFSKDAHDWTKVDGADWRHPDGPKSEAKPDEPVVQVSWNDAVEYAKWAGKRLPTEAEFEYALRGGLVGKRYAWGDELRPGGKPVANWWQGTFPDFDTGEDGYSGRAPVCKFPPNGFGLYDMTGNVWEWCSDWWSEDYYEHSPKENPQGPEKGTERVQRGGSWLCSENYCSNYRAAGRGHSTPDTGLNHLGFRCVKDK